MNKNEIARFKQQLLTLQQQILDDPDNHADATVELDQSRVGRLSRMDALQAQQLALNSKRRQAQYLKAIEGALRRIEQDDYGLCFICDEPIALNRLEFDPTITRCIKCAEIESDD